MVREGFEPSKAEPSDLQSDPFGHSGTSPQYMFFIKYMFKKKWCRLSDSNQSPADYKSAALPNELKRHIKSIKIYEYLNGGSDETRTRDILRDRQAL